MKQKDKLYETKTYREDKLIKWAVAGDSVFAGVPFVKLN